MTQDTADETTGCHCRDCDGEGSMVYSFDGELRTYCETHGPMLRTLAPGLRFEATIDGIDQPKPARWPP